MKHPILAKLDRGEPLFTAIPFVASKRIFGQEFEVGSDLDSIEEGFCGLPTWLWIGGRIYVDQYHVELSVPETSNPLSAVIYTRAMCGQLLREKYSRYNEAARRNPRKWFLNNCDWGEDSSSARGIVGRTFGNHESYSTSSEIGSLREIAPFLVARTVFSAAGWVSGQTFHLSQRARFVKRLVSHNTTSDRGLLCSRTYDKELSEKCRHPNRLHIICGEANMSDIALYLKLGITALMVELSELGALPNIGFNQETIVKDLHKISLGSATWLHSEIPKEPECWILDSLGHKMSVLELLRTYVDAAAAEFKGRDSITDSLLVIANDTLAQLEDPEKNIGSLSRRLDWAAKLSLLRYFNKNKDLDDVGISFEDHDMEYHLLGGGLHDFLVRSSRMERLVSRGMIHRAFTEPPPDTRAAFRGWLAKRLDTHSTGLKLDAASNKSWGQATVNRSLDNALVREFKMDDPFLTYEEYHVEVYKMLGKGK
jgi:hypothetical protein